MGKSKIEWTDKHKQRFWGYVLKTKDCWIWKGALARGYGLFRVGQKNIKAHRFVWIMENGQIPDNLCVLHHCDNKKCVNPSHLFLGTFADNNADKCAKGRQSRLQGIQNSMAKLTSQEVQTIRILYEKGKITHKKLGINFGVARSTITAVLNQDNWNWL